MNLHVFRLLAAGLGSDPTCTLGDHPGIADADAQTATELICHDLAERGAANLRHEVRFGVLGSKILVIVARQEPNAHDERRTLVTGMDEVVVASPRLVDALIGGKPIADTRTVDNVLSSETRRTKTRLGTMAFDGGFFGMSGLGAPAGAAAGIALGLLYRTGSLGISFQMRAGGIGSSERKLGSASIDSGVRYYVTDGDVAPFIGAGLGLAYFKLNHGYSGDSGSGLEANAMVGVEAFRTQHVGLSFAVRADIPAFSLDREYVVPLSLNVGLLFR